MSRAVWLTLAGGIAEVAAGLAIGILGFIAFRLEFYRSGAGDVGPMFGPGTLMYVSFFASLRGMAALFLFVEGLIRVVSAAVVEEPCPTLVGWLVRRRPRWRRLVRRAMPDVLAVAGDGLVLETDRRRDWDGAMTIEHEGVYYTLRSAETIGPERWRYTLGPLPERHLIRGVRTISS